MSKFSRFRLPRMILPAASLIALVGCEPTGTTTPSTPISKTETTATAPASPVTPEKSEAVATQNPSEVSVEIKSWDETLELVAAHKGKIVVLDLWSTSCDPCKEEFPNLVKLHKQHGRDKLVCLSASCDFVGIKGKPPEHYKPQALEFLTTQQATFQNVVLNVEADVLFEKINLASIPAVYVFGRDGQIAKRFDNDAGGDEFTYEENVVPFINELLAQ